MQVHVRRKDGSLAFTRLHDLGDDRMEFESRTGHVLKSQIQQMGYTIHEGWPEIGEKQVSTDKAKRAQLANELAEWNKWQSLAAARGWKLPGNSPLPNHSWINYWKACQRHENDPSSGRPVVPHR